MLISSELDHVTFDVGELPSFALLLLSFEVGQFRTHRAEAITNLLLARASGWLLLNWHHGWHRRHVHVLRYRGDGIRVLVWVLQLSRREEVLILLLMELTWRDEVTPFLLRQLEPSQFVLQLRDTVGMSEHLLTGVRVKTVVYRRCVHVGIERTLANASAVRCTSTVVKLVGSQLRIELDVGVAIWRV